MSILDDAIRQHLDLKRRHGASEDELRQIEDQAFGPPARPGEADESPEPADISDTDAEAPTEFLSAAEPVAPAPPEPAAPPREDPEFFAEGGAPVGDEPDEPEDSVDPDETSDTASPVSGDEAFEVPPYRVEDDDPEPSAMEHPIADVPAPPATPAPPTASEREVIAEQPTQFYDFESAEPPETAPSPSPDELYEERLEEPRLAPSEPPGSEEETSSGDALVQEPAEDDPFEATANEPEPEEDFFDEQSLSDELDQALEVSETEAPVEPPPAEPPPPADPPQPAEPPVEPEPEQDETPEPPADVEEAQPGPPRSEDVLEETPDFLQENPEGERLWFEQKPPKDFDFDE